MGSTQVLQNFVGVINALDLLRVFVGILWEGQAKAEGAGPHGHHPRVHKTVLNLGGAGKVALDEGGVNWRRHRASRARRRSPAGQARPAAERDTAQPTR